VEHCPSGRQAGAQSQARYMKQKKQITEEVQKATFAAVQGTIS
jgi:hypothetical protein